MACSLVVSQLTIPSLRLGKLLRSMIPRATSSIQSFPLAAMFRIVGLAWRSEHCGEVNRCIRPPYQHRLLPTERL